MRFLFVDRILSLEPGISATGIKHVTANDQYWTIDANNCPILMPSIVGETLGQLAAWSVMQACDFKWRPVAGIVADVIITGTACAGETIDLQATIDHWDEEAVAYHCQASVNGQPILSIQGALGPMRPMEEFIDPNVVREQFAMINRPGEPLHTSAEEALPSGQMILMNAQAQFDRITEWQAGERAVAQKMVSYSAPYFSDHFPRKPVLPLTILLSCKAELGVRLLRDGDAASAEKAIIPKRMQRIKMSEFVQPGDIVTTTAIVKTRNDQEVILIFRSTVAGKRICTCEVTYEVTDHE